MRLYSLNVIFVLITFALNAQKQNGSYQYHIHKTQSPIKIDGLIDEDGWQKSELATDFSMVLPMDTSKAAVKTDVRLTYDDENLYIAFINYNKIKGPNIVESLRRDFIFGKNDNDLLFLDTFDDMLNGFSFGANAAGAEWDGVMSEGSKINLSWENKWKSTVKADETKWVWEAAIPFKTIRYKKGVTKWGINFSRLDMKTTEKSSWTPISRQFPTSSLALAGVLVWDTPPPSVGSNISIIPYVSAGTTKNFENGSPTNFKKNIGFDAKIGLSSSLNLDLSFNPDFSQVEADQQQTNLDRFELFYPEKRQFFLENGDLFSGFGYSDIRPFFSRRIGIVYNSATGGYDQTPILGGARLSGKIGDDWRISVMDMQTAKTDTLAPAQNFGVLALQRRVFARSNIGFIFVNRQSIDFDAFNNNPELINKSRITSFNRNLGLEFNLASPDNLWTGKMSILKSFDVKPTTDNAVAAGNLQYSSRHFTGYMEYNYVGENYNAEAGYVTRTAYQNFFPKVSYLFFPKSSIVLSHGPQASSNIFFDKFLNKVNDNEMVLSYGVSFQNRSEFQIWGANNFVRLLKPFDPTNYGGDTLAIGTTHNWYSWGLNFSSQPQSLFTYSIATRYGGYYANGNRLRLGGDIGYRFQPYVSLSLSVTYNHLDFKSDPILPKSFQNNAYDFWLIGPRIDVTFTNKLFFTNYVQYNNQAKNININSRFQWRYSPASDLYLAYTDNYLPESFQAKNRALVLKFTYWWNL